MPRKRQNQEVMLRDQHTALVVANLRQIMAKRKMKPNALQDGVRALAGNQTTSVTDFLSDNRTSSPRVATLGLIAAVLDVPVIAFFVPPDTRDDLMAILRILDSGKQLTAGQAGGLVQALLEAKWPPQPTQGAADEAGTATD